MIEFNANKMTIFWPDGLNHNFHPFWLRERSFAPTNKDSATGHRLQEVALMPLDIKITHAVQHDGNIELAFSDGHCCRYTLDDLRRQATNLLPVDLAGDKQTWDNSLVNLPQHDANQILNEDVALLDIIDDIARFGFVLINNVGTQEDDLAYLRHRIGPIRPTNWGTIADIKSIVNAFDLSMTGRALEPHVDNPYRLPGPGYIIPAPPAKFC